ncbi:hypothetical protein AB0N93_13595 [Streptomyces sp. NPDC091267]|uniref:hypothetical protein n=1 Tax=unclassified Streptomyces TaxID=2593676 RepID=UPI00341F88C0
MTGNCNCNGNGTGDGAAAALTAEAACSAAADAWTRGHPPLSCRPAVLPFHGLDDACRERSLNLPVVRDH